MSDRPPRRMGSPSKKRRRRKTGWLVPEVDQLGAEVHELGVGALPVEPGDLVVLAVGVVVAALGVAELVAVPSIGTPVLSSSVVISARRRVQPQPQHLRVVGRALDAAVPRAVVVGAVAVLLAVGLVVLEVVGDQVGEGEPVVRGDEVDAGVGVPPGPSVQVGAAGQPVGEVGQGPVGAAPVVPDRVPIAAVPLRPQGREVAHLVAALAEVPGLGDELDLAHHRVHLDQVEERRQPVDLVELAGQAGGEVEPEAVHVHLAHPVAQRVDDQLEHVRVAHVQRVAGAGGVEVVAPAVGQPVVGGVVDAAERQRRAEVVPLRRVVVDDVEYDLDPGLVHGLDQVLELGDDLFHPPRGVVAVRGEEGDRVVPPVIAQGLLGQVVVMQELVHRHQLDRGDAQPLQVLDDGGVRHPGVGAAQVGRDLRVAHGEPLDVALVQHGLVPGDAQRTVVAPLEPRAADHRARHERGAVLVVAGPVVAAEGVAVHGRVPLHLPVERPRVGVEQQLVLVAADARVGEVRPVHAVSVALPGADAGQEAVPHVAVGLGHVQPLLAAAGVVEQAELDALGDLGEQGEVGADAVVGGAKRERLSRPLFGFHALHLPHLHDLPHLSDIGFCNVR